MKKRYLYVLLGLAILLVVDFATDQEFNLYGFVEDTAEDVVLENLEDEPKNVEELEGTGEGTGQSAISSDSAESVTLLMAIFGPNSLWTAQITSGDQL